MTKFDLNIKVAIWMVTYNHEDYITQAIESVLMQKTNFSTHLFIGEDCSKDNTDKICEDFANKYPQKITLIKNKKNLGSNNNAKQIYDLCFKSKSKYIAMLEGDDYWTDPLKLQKQFDFLESNLDYNICFHEVEVYIDATKKLEKNTITRKVSSTTTSQELAKGNYIHTPSVVLRNNFILSKWFFFVPVGDWTLYMIAVKDRKIMKLNECMAVYRSHDNGIWSGKNRLKKLKMTIKTFSLVYNNVQLDSVSKQNLKNTLAVFKDKYKKNRKSSLFIRKVKNKIKHIFRIK